MSDDARAHILARIRLATGDRAPADDTPRPPLPAPAVTPGDPGLLAERIADYAATVTRVDDPAAIPDVIAAILHRHHATRIAIPHDLDPALRPPGVELVADDPPLDHDAIAGADGVLTACALAIAQTGTIVLDHTTGQGRRALTLLPDLHVCVIRHHQVVADVPDAVARLIGATTPITFVSGPSATSDIELNRVEGVHGPRRLEAVLAP